MNVMPNKRLFWFLKDNLPLDLSDPSTLEMYVQQVISKGTTQDVRHLLRNVEFKCFKQVFANIRHFLPWEVRTFWEDFIAGY